MGRIRREQCPASRPDGPDRRCIPTRGLVGALAALSRPAPHRAQHWKVDPNVPRSRGSRVRVPVGNPVGMRLGSHVSRGRGGGCGSGGRDRSGLARGPCSTLGPPRAASSRARPLGPAEALSARQGPGHGLPERMSARCSAEGEAAGVRGRGSARAGARRRRERQSAPQAPSLSPQAEPCVAATAPPLAPPRRRPHPGPWMQTARDAHSLPEGCCHLAPVSFFRLSLNP